jgi:small redox-active disulfide protein 2
MTEKVIKETMAELGCIVDVEKVTDPMKIAEYGVFATPAVVVDGEVKLVGKLPGKEDIMSWLKKGKKEMKESTL